jgi:hypothetical protein
MPLKWRIAAAERAWCAGLCILCASLLWTASLAAQSGAGALLRGIVTDSSGAYVPNAKITLTDSAGASKTTNADDLGAYRFTGLAAGEYTVQAFAPQLILPSTKVNYRGGIQVLNLQLRVESVVQTVDVVDDAAPTVSTDAGNNASATVLTGNDLDAVSDNPEDMLADLQALAGPSAGPDGGSVYVDGFAGGELPPKETIREVRINQNPFSPEYDRLGFGRIDVATKPGADRFRGSLNYNLGSDVWNSRNPYSATKAPLLLNEWENTISGPLGKNTSFVLDANQNNVNNGAIVNAVTLDPASLAESPLFQNYKVIQKRTRINPRIDRQIGEKNTLSIRYAYTHGDIDGAGIGGFNLITRGAHNTYSMQTVQAMDTVVAGPAIFDLRFRYYRNAGENIPVSTSPADQVLGSFTSGGSSQGNNFATFNGYESHNDASVVHGTHLWKFGVRLRDEFDYDTSPTNFNGTFIFGGGVAPQLDAQNQPVLSGGQPVMVSISSLEQYRRTLLFQAAGLSAAQIFALGGGPTQFSINAGNPTTNVSQFDIGLYVGDDWRARPNLTLSYGLRYEVQTNIHDPLDFAPRVGVAWAPGGSGKAAKPKTVLRAGFGVFYYRFDMNNTLTAARYNGIVQQRYVINSPNFFPNVPPIAALAVMGTTSSSVTQTIAPDIRSPELMQTALSVERQLPLNTTLAVTYSNTHLIHMTRSEDVNAPIEGTYSPLNPSAALYPLGHPGAVLQMETNGQCNQNQMTINVSSKVNSAVSVNGSYILNQSLCDTDSVSTFPGSPYTSQGEYGPSAIDIRNRLNLTASVNTKWNVRVSPFMVLQSGTPFNITTGNDLFGTTLLNSRPGIATDPTRPGLIQTSYGLLDPNPIPGEQILGRNFGRGPGMMSVNLRIGKTFDLGPKREGGGSGGGRGFFSTPVSTRRYSLSISASIRNVLNHTNPGPIIGNITSPLFGQANQMFGTLNGEGFSENANNRRSELQMRFTF